MEFEVRHVTNSEYKLSHNGNLKLSQKFYAKGLQQIKLNSLNVLEEGVILRGDLGQISLGQSTIIDKKATIKPGLELSPISYKSIKIGSNCYIGKNTIISCSFIGDYTYVGTNSIISDRCEIGSNVKILEDSYLAPETKVPDNCVFGGLPAKYLGDNYESSDLIMRELCSSFYKSIVINVVTNNK